MKIGKQISDSTGSSEVTTRFDDTQAQRRDEVGARSKSRLREYSETIAVTIVVALFLKFFVLEAYRIPTASMEDTLLAGDFLLVNKFIYGAKTPRYIPFTNAALPFITFPAFAEPRLGDVVVFEFPGGSGEGHNRDVVNYVKRCIATPGDTLEIVDKVVYVNGQEIPLPRSAKVEKKFPKGARDFTRGSGLNRDNYDPVIIPKSGQEIRLSVDNIGQWRKLIEREGHSVTEQSDEVLIDGVPAMSYTVQNDYYFMMGDNRGNSLDSRFWGFVSEDLIIGKAMMVYWSWEKSPVRGGVFGNWSAIRWNRIGTLVK